MPKKKGFFNIDDAEYAEDLRADIAESGDGSGTNDIGDSAAGERALKRSPKIIFVFAAAVLVFAAFFLIRFLYNNAEGKESRYIPDDWLQNVDDSRDTVLYLYTPDWETDITTVEEYMALLKDKYIYYIEGSYGRNVEKEDCLSAGGKGLKFMSEYIETVKSGDHEALNSMFTDGYFKDHDRYEAFPQQKIFDVYISKHDLDPDSDELYYVLSYKIYRNDGLFRDDIDQYAERSQLFVLVNTADGLKIDDVIAVNYLNRANQ